MTIPFNGWVKTLLGVLVGSGILWGAFEVYADQKVVEKAVTGHEERISKAEESVQALKEIHIRQEAREEMENQVFRDLMKTLNRINESGPSQ